MKPVTGKTYLMLAIATHISFGTPLPGEHTPGEPDRALYLTPEGGLVDTIARRLAVMRANTASIVCLAGSIVNGAVEEGPIALSRDLDLISRRRLGGAAGPRAVAAARRGTRPYRRDGGPSDERAARPFAVSSTGQH